MENLKYRIVTDGIRYKIHVLVYSWWFHRPKWKTCGRNHPDLGWVSITEYSIKEAEKTLRQIKAEELACKQGYKLVAEY